MDADFKYDPKTKRWINTKMQTIAKEENNTVKNKVKEKKKAPLPVQGTFKTSAKEMYGSIAGRYVIKHMDNNDKKVCAEDVFGMVRKNKKK